MTTDLDDLLRHELSQLITRPTTSPDALRRDVLVRVRRRRRRRALGGGIAAVALVGAAATTALGDRESTVTSDASSPNAQTEGLLAFVELQARGGPEGTAEVRLRFDGPLPDLPITSATSIHPLDGIDAPGIVMASQPAREVHVCGDVHFFDSDGPGSLDVLVPAQWLLNSASIYDPVDPTFTTLPPAPGDDGAIPAKVISCGPYDGYVQVSVWGGEPADLDDVDVQLSADRTELTVVLD